jgi:tetratricopeptide (TPR) repeat protein
MKNSIYKKLTLAIAAAVFGLMLQIQPGFAQTETNPVVEALFKSAEKNADEGKLDAAINDYNKIIAIAPEDPDAFYGRGYIYFRKADYDKAIADFTKTLEIKPDDFYTFYTRGQAYYRKGDYENSIADHTSELELQPRRELGQIERGNAYMKLKQYDEAFADYNSAIVYSSAPAAYLARGRAFEERGDKTSAIGDLRYYLEAIPDDTKARESLLKLGVNPSELPAPILSDDQKIPAAAKNLFVSAIQKIGQADYPGAKNDLTAAIKIYPQFARAYFYRGYAFELPGSLIRYKEIQADYAKAITLDPKFAEAYLRRAYNQFYNNPSWKTIKPDLDRAVLLNPKSARAYYYRGMFTGTDAKKMLDFDQAIKLNPFYAEAYLERAERFEEKNLHEKAIADYSMVIKINPNDSRAFEERAKIYCKQGKKQLASEDEKKVVELAGEFDSPCGEN